MIEAVLDTGYTELLSIPLGMAQGMPVIQVTEVELADGSLQLADVVRAKIEWMGEEITVRTLVMGNGPLIGVRLLEGCRLTANFVPNGPVAVTIIP